MNEEMTNYQVFMTTLNSCIGMAKEYLSRCTIDGRVDADSIYYFKNLLGLYIDEETGDGKILCSNTNPQCENESMKSYNIRKISIDEDLFNKSSYEFDKDHLDSSLLHLVKMLDSDTKVELYDALRGMIEDEMNDIGGL